MLRKISISWFVIAGIAVFGNLQAQEPAPGHPLREYFKKDGTVAVLPLLNTEMAQKELELTDTQKEKIAPLQKEHINTIRKFTGGNPDLTPEEITKKLDEANAEITKKLEAILKPHQLDRLLEMLLQLGGPILLSESDVGKLFDLTDEQKEKIKAIADEATESSMKAMASVPPAKDRVDIKKQLREGFKKQQPIVKEANEKIKQILTSKQRDMLDKMKGKEVDTTKLFEEIAEAMELPGF